MGALAALHARETSGQGQVIDSALYEAVLQVMESVVPEYDVMGLVRQRSGSILPGIAPSNVYPCADGEYMIGGNGDTIFARLAQAMGRPELASDPRYATHVARGERQAELDALIGSWTHTQTIEQLEALMIAHSVPAGRVYTGRDMLADPHFIARSALAAVPHPQHGAVRMQAPMPKLSMTPSAIRRPAPRAPGEHNAEVYGEQLQLSPTELADLAARGVI
jgi:formyl-CoA transferase